MGDVTNNNIQTDEVSIKDLILKIQGIFKYLWSKWKFILIIGLLGGAIGYLFMKSKTPVFVSLTSFVLEDGESNAGGLGQYAGIASMVGVDLSGNGGGIFQGDNLLELYKSRSMISETLLTEAIFDGKRQMLIDRYLDFNKLRAKWNRDPELKNLNFKTNKNGALNRLQDSILTFVVNDLNKNYLVVSKPDKKLSVINVKVTAPDEQFSLIFNNQIVSNVSRFYVQTKTKKSLKNLNILEHQTDSIRGALNGSIIGAAISIDANPNANAARQVLRVPNQKRQFDTETNKAILMELVKNLELSKISLRKETPLIQIIDTPVLPLPIVKSSGLFGVIIGGILGGIFSISILLVSKFLKDIMK